MSQKVWHTENFRLKGQLIRWEGCLRVQTLCCHGDKFRGLWLAGIYSVHVSCLRRTFSWEAHVNALSDSWKTESMLDVKNTDTQFMFLCLFLFLPNQNRSWAWFWFRWRFLLSPVCCSGWETVMKWLFSIIMFLGTDPTVLTQTNINCRLITVWDKAILNCVSLIFSPPLNLHITNL